MALWKKVADKHQATEDLRLDLSRPFWEDPKNQLLLDNPRIIFGLKLVWWFFTVNAVSEEIIHRMYKYIKQQYEATPELRGYYKESGLAKQCRAFLDEPLPSSKYYSPKD